MTISIPLPRSARSSRSWPVWAWASNWVRDCARPRKRTPSRNGPLRSAAEAIMKIVVAEKVAAGALQVLRDEAGWTVVTPEQIKDGLAGELRDADALIVRSAVLVDTEILRGAAKLRVIGRAGVG